MIRLKYHLSQGNYDKSNVYRSNFSISEYLELFQDKNYIKILSRLLWLVLMTITFINLNQRYLGNRLSIQGPPSSRTVKDYRIFLLWILCVLWSLPGLFNNLSMRLSCESWLGVILLSYFASNCTSQLYKKSIWTIRVEFHQAANEQRFHF